MRKPVEVESSSWLTASKVVGTSVLQPWDLNFANILKDLGGEIFPRAPRRH